MAPISETEKSITSDLRDLIEDGRARIIASIQQELLSGIRDRAQFEKLRTYLRALPDERASTDDYEEAARWNNQRRSRGIADSSADFLICAIAIACGWQIFPRDDDFLRYARVIPIKLYLSGGATDR